MAGIGLILFTRKMREKPDDIDLANKAKRVILNRSILLFFIGTLDSIYWPLIYSDPMVHSFYRKFLFGFGERIAIY